MTHPKASKAALDTPGAALSDTLWPRVLLGGLSMLVTVVFIALVATSIMATDDREIAIGGDPTIEDLLPAGGSDRD